MADAGVAPIGWERALMAAEKVKERLRRATKALNDVGVPYAVAGGNAGAEWVARVDDGADRNTRDVDLLIRRSDELAVRLVLSSHGMDTQVRCPDDAYLNSRTRRRGEIVYLLFAGEKFLPTEDAPMPSLDESVKADGYQVVGLEALVRMKLTAFRLIDRVHLRDLIGVGQIDATWLARFPPELAARLQHLFDTPGG